MPTMTFLPVQLRTRSTSDPHGALIRGILPDQKGGSSPSTRETWMTLMMLLYLPLKMWLQWLFLVSILFVLVSTNNGKQIFFDTFLDIPPLRKSMSTMNLATETFVCVMTILPLNAALERSWQPCWRHNSPLKKYMYSNGAVELRHVLDVCNPDVNPYDKFNIGRLFAAFIQGKQQTEIFSWSFIEWWLVCGSSKLPWKIFIGCNQGHSTGIVRPVESSHQLSMIELCCLGWVFMWQIRSLWVLFSSMVWSDSIVILCISCMTMTMVLAIFEKDLVQRHLVIMIPPDTAFWRQPCCWEMAMICFWLQMVLFLCYDDIPCRYFEIVGEFPYLGYHFANRTTGHGLPPEIRVGSWRPNMTVREKYEEYLPSGEISKYLKMTRLLSGEFPIHLFQREEQQRGNSWAKKSLRGICSCSTTFQMTEDIQKLVMICRMDCQAH